MIHPHTKEQVFDHCVTQRMGKLPTDVTFAKLEKAKTPLMMSQSYARELTIFGLERRTIYELRDADIAAYQQLVHHFWSMVLDLVYKQAAEKERLSRY